MGRNAKGALYPALVALVLSLFISNLYTEEAVEALAQRVLLAEKDGYCIYAGADVQGEIKQYTRQELLQGLLLCVSGQTPIPEDMPVQQVRNVRKMIGLYVPVTEDVSLSEETIYALCALCDENPLVRTWIVSGARSPAEQAAVQNAAFEQYRSMYSVAEALQRAQQKAPLGGKSEHQLGTSFDLQFQGSLDWAYADPLDRSKDGRWLRENAWRFGFIRRYPPEKSQVTGVLGEELHFRYVGKTHAAVMQMTQWCLEEYLDALHRYGGLTLETPQGERAYVLCCEITEKGAAFRIPEGYVAAPSADNQGYAVCALTPDQSLSAAER